MGATAPSQQATAPGATPPAAHDDAIEVQPTEAPVEEDEFETSDYDASSTASTSVTSSIYHHHYENGRRFHHYKHGRYPIPNDDTEQNREDMKHALHLELTDGSLFSAPVGDHPQKIIDLGTGTGIWAIDVADQFPSAEVIGVDLSPIQSLWIPPNLRFVVDDFEDEWMNGDNYDLVHLRSISPIVKDMQKLLERCLENTRPGGWVELCDFGGQILSDDDTLGNSTLPEFFQKTGEALGKFGMNFWIANELGGYLEKAGYTKVTLKTIKVPIGTWPKDKTLRLCGKYMRFILSDLLNAMAAKPLLALGMSRDEAIVFAAQARRDMDRPSVHAYLNYRIWTAQKAL